MAKLPDTFSPRPVARPTRGLARVSEAGAVGREIESVGQTITGFGDVLFDREATALATERDTQISNQIRDLIYNPETGFASLRGQAAVEARPQILQKLEELRGSAGEGLNGTAKRKLQPSLDRRLESAFTSIERQTLQERDNWLAGASAARVESAYQDSLFNPADTKASLAVIENETRAEALRMGWDAAQTEVTLEARRSKLFADQVTRIAAADPVAAMQYMRENQDKMVASDVTNIEAKLQPEIKRYVGRSRGAEAALGGTSPAYLAAIRSAESGGNDRAKNPRSSATGRYQFTSGTWADLMENYPSLGLTKDGRMDPAQQERAIAAFTAGNANALARADLPATGANLYAAHFLGASGAVSVLGASDGTMVASIVPPSVIVANPFLSDMTVADFKGWASRKGGGQDIAYSASTSGIETLLDIEDPIERDAALEEYELRNAVKVGQQKATMAAAQDAAFQMIESGLSVDTLPVEHRQALGQDAMSSLRSYQKAKASGTPIETDDATYYQLRRMQADNPAQFRSVNMMEYRDKLDDADWQKLVDAQTKPSSDITTAAASTLMTTANRHLTSAGIDTSPKPGSDDAAQIAAMQTRLLRWQDDFVSGNGRAPTQTEIDERIGRELLPVVINPRGMMNEAETTVFGSAALDMTPEQLAESDIRLLDTDIPKAVIREQIIALQEAGEPVTAEALVDRILTMFETAGLR